MSAAARIFSATVLLRRLFGCGALLSAALIFAPPPQRRAHYMRCFSELGAAFWNNVTNLESGTDLESDLESGRLFIREENIISLCYNMWLFIM